MVIVTAMFAIVVVFAVVAVVVPVMVVVMANLARCNDYFSSMTTVASVMFTL
jgi:hypothetical protein